MCSMLGYGNGWVWDGLTPQRLSAGLLGAPLPTSWPRPGTAGLACQTAMRGDASPRQQLRSPPVCAWDPSALRTADEPLGETQVGAGSHAGLPSCQLWVRSVLVVDKTGRCMRHPHPSAPLHGQGVGFVGDTEDTSFSLLADLDANASRPQWFSAKSLGGLGATLTSRGCSSTHLA